MTVVSGSGGSHLIYSVPDAEKWEIRNSTKTIGAGVDVRGEAGFSVAPGSLHFKSGKLYEWEEGRSPDDIAIAGLPIALLRKCFFAYANNRHNKAPDGSSFEELRTA